MSYEKLPPRGIPPRVPIRTLGLRPIVRGWAQIDPTARGLHPFHDHVDRVSEPQVAPRVLRHQRCAELVQGPPVAQAPARQEALESLVAEAHEGALLDHADNL